MSRLVLSVSQSLLINLAHVALFYLGLYFINLLLSRTVLKK